MVSTRRTVHHGRARLVGAACPRERGKHRDARPQGALSPQQHRDTVSLLSCFSAHAPVNYEIAAGAIIVEESGAVGLQAQQAAPGAESSHHRRRDRTQRRCRVKRKTTACRRLDAETTPLRVRQLPAGKTEAERLLLCAGLSCALGAKPLEDRFTHSAALKESGAREMKTNNKDGRVSLPATATNRKVERHERNILLTTRQPGELFGRVETKSNVVCYARLVLSFLTRTTRRPPIALAPEKQTPPNADAAGREKRVSCFVPASRARALLRRLTLTL